MKFIISLLIILPLASQTKSANLSWQDATNPIGTVYNVYRINTPCATVALTATFTRIATNVVAKSYQDPNLSPGIYCYQVTATNLTAGTVETSPSNMAQGIVISTTN
jgi:hypothetical protein